MTAASPIDNPLRTFDMEGVHCFALWLADVIAKLAATREISIAQAASIVAEVRISESAGFVMSPDEAVDFLA